MQRQKCGKTSKIALLKANQNNNLEWGFAVNDLDELLKKKIRYEGGVPVITRLMIEELCEHILEEYHENATMTSGAVDVEFLIENCFGMQIDIQTLQPDGEILGETIFIDGEREVFGGKNGTTPERLRVKSGTMLLDAFMYDNMVIRARFTQAHELGHWIMHQRFYSGSDNRACRSNMKQPLHFSHICSKTPIEWTEWQANAFAAALLLPKKAMHDFTLAFLKNEGLSWSKLTDFDDYESRKKYVELLHLISEDFYVSLETARLRLNKLAGVQFPN